MNRENMTVLRNHLVYLRDTGQTDKFYMSAIFRDYYKGVSYVHHTEDFFHDHPDGLHVCGTAACLAGWTHFLFNPANTTTNSAYVAQEALGLTDREADYFTEGGWYDGSMRLITIHEAIEYLDKVLEADDIFVEVDR